MLRFIVQPDRSIPSDPGPRAAILVPNDWDDYGFLTSYDLWIRPYHGSMPVEIGRVKIARPFQEPGPYRLPVGTFRREPPEHTWVSLGQDDLYYQRIMDLDRQTAHELLHGLGDLAANPPMLVDFQLEDVVRISLLRSITTETVTQQFARILDGGQRLTNYNFHFHPPSAPDTPPRPALEFKVSPDSVPSSNIHVLIGRNGVGKTTLLRSLATAAVRPLDLTEGDGHITYLQEAGFANVLLVTFSAFDPFTGIIPSPDATARYNHIGLVMGSSPGGSHERAATHLKDRAQLGEEFIDSLDSILTSGHYDRWVKAVTTLASDAQFNDAVIRHVGPSETITFFVGPDPTLPPLDLQTGTGRSWHEIFASLSSGHALVLLTLTRLVNLVAERTLVLLDEPEAHLHPPLLSAFVRALSDLLTERNGVAITATHSPVVLQEVPRSCVYKIGRTGERGRARRPRIETYGENVGVLTHEIFGLEVMKSGFYSEIERAVHEFGTYDQVLDHFDGQLGDEAKGLLRILLADREDEGL
ncbi:ATP-dependent endonuclease [Streptomyces sp. NPDC058623]|uniref:ATP-dependent nuclease n=1 Tax=Streptomyces sp. NPDC058623 TaxID=3346563 RepID=UPI00365A9483